MRTFCLTALALFSSVAFAAPRQTFMPENTLNLEDNFETAGGITQAQFNAVIDRAEHYYKPIVAAHDGAKLTVNRKWTDSTVNADAEQNSATDWQVNMYGGLARRAEVTEDGFAMVLCHEIGHHLGGYPYVQDWAADEGQADTHATGACAYKVFAANSFLSMKAAIEVPDNMKAKCDAHHASAAERDICYRTLAASKSLADLLGNLGGTGPTDFNKPDTSTVSETNHEHPAAQCRLDTYVAAALCGNAKWDYALIPGKSFSDRNSLAAQAEAFAHGCEGEAETQRPRCWFAVETQDGGGGGTPTPTPSACPLGDPTICALMCTIDPSQPWCNQ